MLHFAAVFDAIDSTTSTTAKVDAMAAYFRSAAPEDAAWALYFLTGQKLKRLIPAREVAGWAMSMSSTPPWLFEECYSIVGDLAETVSLLIDHPTETSPADNISLSAWVNDRLIPLRGLHESMRAEIVTGWLSRLDRKQSFLVIKLLTGSLRVGVSRTLVTRALAQASGLDVSVIADRLMGDWTPSAKFIQNLFSSSASPAIPSQPYPFFLASPLTDPVDALGPRSDWQAEWKWDGIRAQLIRRGPSVFLWSRGEENLTERFPEIIAPAARLPAGVVLDGEVLAFENDHPLPFARLQRRIGRRNLSAKVQQECPVVFMAYDLLEHDGADIRSSPLAARRALLESLLANRSQKLRLSPIIDAPTWPALEHLREESRDRSVEGIMLKKLDSVYGSGRERGPWWKWKIAPYTIDAVLVYAQPGHGRRANLLTDYTFAVRDGDDLVPVAKAYSGLNNDEIRQLDTWIRANTVERFGPVRAVTPHHVFELAFEAIAASPRHRAGIAVRFPRISRWRTDKTPADADTLDTVKQLLHDANRST